MMTEHTPEPWCFKGPSPGGTQCDDGGDYAIYAKMLDLKTVPFIIAETIHKVDWGFEAPAKANTSLIGAAPDLIEACEKILAVYLELDEAKAINAEMKAIDKVEAAVAKAKGEANLD